MKYLGVDYGSKRVGVAVSDERGTIAFPRATLANDKELLTRLVRTAQEERVEAIVVGDTRSHGGGENPVTPEAERFMEVLARETGLPLSRGFEVFSSIEASRHAPKGKEHDDAAAAALILQRFLDMNASR
ncbi:MAG TPA: Holliday junction resolvase RuvX [Candidatus Paceibacterota bacterium]|nr:Holliday junction resolvase RuvX [Candidatus Paceibacterota bacterium]